MAIRDENPWQGDYKIPWNDPAFSGRMLAEHLSQEHDLASRRSEWIDRQVEWIHRDLLGNCPARILDLGCGPGFYSHRLAALGHRCVGIDFGPASIEYANSHKPVGACCEFLLGDLRQEDFGGPFDLAMMLYGEFNVFSQKEISHIMQKANSSLVVGGKLLAEIQTPESVEQLGRAETTEQSFASGLFSDGPYRCRVESFWRDDQKVAVQNFTVIEEGTEQPRIYRNTTKAWSKTEVEECLEGVGFCEVSPCYTWPCNIEALELWIAKK